MPCILFFLFCFARHTLLLLMRILLMVLFGRRKEATRCTYDATVELAENDITSEAGWLAGCVRVREEQKRWWQAHIRDVIVFEIHFFLLLYARSAVSTQCIHVFMARRLMFVHNIHLFGFCLQPFWSFLYCILLLY